MGTNKVPENYNSATSAPTGAATNPNDSKTTSVIHGDISKAEDETLQYYLDSGVLPDAVAAAFRQELLRRATGAKTGDWEPTTEWMKIRTGPSDGASGGANNGRSEDENMNSLSAFSSIADVEAPADASGGGVKFCQWVNDHRRCICAFVAHYSPGTW